MATKLASTTPIESIHDIPPELRDTFWTDYKVWAFHTLNNQLLKQGVNALTAFVKAIEVTADSSASPEECSERELRGFVLWFNDYRLKRIHAHAKQWRARRRLEVQHGE